ncbi:MAG: flavodoxin family protein [bacterium]
MIVKSVQETTNDDLVNADAIIVSSPVYFGSMAASVKEMFDKSVKVRGQLKDKVGGFDAIVTS